MLPITVNKVWSCTHGRQAATKNRICLTSITLSGRVSYLWLQSTTTRFRHLFLCEHICTLQHSNTCVLISCDGFVCLRLIFTYIHIICGMALIWFAFKHIVEEEEEPYSQHGWMFCSIYIYIYMFVMRSVIRNHTNDTAALLYISKESLVNRKKNNKNTWQMNY